MTYLSSLPHKNSLSDSDFVISDYLDVLTPNPKEKSKYICPVCNGHNLSVAKDGLRFNCFNGCDSKEVTKAVLSLAGSGSVTASGYSSPKQSPVIVPNWAGKSSQPGGSRRLTSVTHYDYSKTQRIERRDYLKENGKRSKSFSYQHLEGNNWVNGRGDRPWPAYQLESSLSFRQSYIIAVEGEKCVDTLTEFPYEFPAFTFGGGDWDNRELLESSLSLIKSSGKTLIIFPDNDKIGYDKAGKLATISKKIGLSYVLIPLTDFWIGCREKSDIVNFFDAHDCMYAINKLTTIVIDAITKLSNNDSLKLNDQSLDALSVKDSSLDLILKPFGSLLTMNNNYSDDNWLVEGLLPMGETVILSSLPKVGKSLLCYDLLASVVTGNEFLSYPVKQGKVALIQTDETCQDMSERLLNLDIPDACYDQDIFFLNSFSFQRDYDALKKSLEIIKPSLIIIDCFRSFFAGLIDENSSKEVANFMYDWKRFITSIGAACIITHHNNKDRNNRGNARVSGSTALLGAVWGTWILSKKSEGLLLEVDARSLSPVSLSIELNQDFHWVKVSGGASSVSRSDSDSSVSTKSLVLDCLGRFASPEAPMTNKEIAAKISKPLATVKRLIGSLVSEGLIDFCLEDKRKFYYCSTCRATDVLLVQDGSDHLPTSPTSPTDPIGDPIGDPINLIVHNYNTEVARHVLQNKEQSNKCTTVNDGIKCGDRVVIPGNLSGRVAMVWTDKEIRYCTVILSTGEECNWRVSSIHKI